MDDFAKLQYLCKSLGGSLESVNYLFEDSWDFFHCPFDSYLGLYWQEKRILYQNHKIANIPHIIHEMGHVFASTQPPNKSDEWEFFGWEWAVVKYLKLSEEKWRENNNGYVIDGADTEFGKLSKTDQEELLQERFEYAQQKKLVNKKGKPLAIR